MQFIELAPDLWRMQVHNIFEAYSVFFRINVNFEVPIPFQGFKSDFLTSQVRIVLYAPK